MEIKPIVTKADHRAALKEIESLMSARSGVIPAERESMLRPSKSKWIPASAGMTICCTPTYCPKLDPGLRRDDG
jgi:hypothetical protein